MEDVLDHPTIAVPKHGTHVVKFDLAAQYTLRKKYGTSMQDVGIALTEALPRKGVGDITIPGRVNEAFLFDTLSACLEDSLGMSPRDLAKCYDDNGGYLVDVVGEIVVVLGKAFAKTRWSSKIAQAAATATGTTEQPAVQ